MPLKWIGLSVAKLGSCIMRGNRLKSPFFFLEDLKSGIILELTQSFSDLSNEIIDSSRSSSELSWFWANHLYKLWDILLWDLTETIQSLHASEETLFWWIAVEILQESHCQLHSYIIKYLQGRDIKLRRLMQHFPQWDIFVLHMLQLRQTYIQSENICIDLAQITAAL
jgi:hypothetical protein